MAQAKATNARGTARILIADDDPIVRDILRNLLSSGSEFAVVGEAT